MKRTKAIIIAAVVFIMSLSGGLHASGLDYCGTIQYVVSDGSTVITGYTGSPETISLPSQIDGKPVTEIRENAFYKCVTLKEIIIPESVSKIGHHAFFCCTSLETAKINGNLQQVSEGLFYGCEKLKGVKFRSSPSVIGSYAFYGCRSLTGFTVPSGVTDIGKYCFSECTNLEKITLCSSLKNIEEYAFYSCEKLKKITLSDSLLSIGKYAVGFSENGKSDSITITGTSGSIAENYAKTNDIRFRDRIRYKNPDNINASVLSQFFTWFSFAVVYTLIMAVLLTGAKRKRKSAL